MPAKEAKSRWPRNRCPRRTGGARIGFPKQYPPSKMRISSSGSIDGGTGGTELAPYSLNELILKHFIGKAGAVEMHMFKSPFLRIVEHFP